ncbi:putative phage abortive infection protein [Pedosphaera parvula]|uniref:Phage abortive infection protein n=1 Tax=Pedosphaera parvula (strain Ellin514) TaxID=320771 RepID=B9XI11_PEDPL|nr:putative phage abortive infection protein [Pedosphaera parvula]EEF60504.1 hypothetical protein Cflav_PD3474 [Pedosphaera parvula Ellin514]
MNQKSEKANPTWNQTGVRYGIWICIVAAIVFVILGFVAARLGYQTPRPGLDHLTDLGNFGSYLQGTTASLWSLAGLLIIFVAFLAQQQQLTLQQRQFEQQSFENHFFQLLTLHDEIVKTLRCEDVEAEGSLIFRVMHRRTVVAYQDVEGGPMEHHTEASAVKCYQGVFDSNPEVLGHYFRSLYHIIKFVDDSRPADKKRYTSIVRARLSAYEHVLLHYNGLSEYGVKKFKPLIEEYELLENMGPGLLMNPEHPTSYSPKAFGDDRVLFKFQRSNPTPAQSPHLAVDSKPA